MLKSVITDRSKDRKHKTMLLELKRLTVPPGHQLLLSQVSWQELEEILAELGEGRSARLSYSKGVLEIMTPLMGHETSKVLIGDLVKIMGYPSNSRSQSHPGFCSHQSPSPDAIALGIEMQAISS